jgi:formylglycine-generating enzyme required for sulfatase activity
VPVFAAHSSTEGVGTFPVDTLALETDTPEGAPPAPEPVIVSPEGIPVVIGAASQTSSRGAMITNSIGMQLAFISPGQFTMGSPSTEAGRIGTEQEHAVQITRPFCMGIHEVTQGQFQQVMGINPSQMNPQKRPELQTIDTTRLPVDSVLWSEAVEFCRRLSARPEEQAAGRVYRLPTEAEWEYACRGGGSTAYNVGQRLGSADANFKVAGLPMQGQRTMIVGAFRPNAFGLFDMHGNVEEWCSDYYDYAYYRYSPVVCEATASGQFPTP